MAAVARVSSSQQYWFSSRRSDRARRAQLGALAANI